MDRFLYCLVLIMSTVSVFALPVGSVRDFDVTTYVGGPVTTVTATVRAVQTVRPGLNVSLWVEDTVWNQGGLNGLNETGLDDRQLVVNEFSLWISRTVVPKLESSYYTIQEVQNSPSPGLNILFLDLKDGFSQNGSYIAARFHPPDQDLSTGFNGMNLLYVDVNPGTIATEIIRGINKRKTYQEVTRALGYLALYQQDSTEEAWIKEGFSQFMIYRFLNQEPFPSAQARILDAPSQATTEAVHYLTDLSSMRLAFNVEEKDVHRIFVSTNPRNPNDNRNTRSFRGMNYLFFNYIFHRAGGNFQRRVTDGDRFYQALMKESTDGLEGLNKVLTANSLPTAQELYADFLLSCLIRTTESRYSLKSFNQGTLSLGNYSLIQVLNQDAGVRLNPFGVSLSRFFNPTGSDQYEVLVTIPAGLGNSKVVVLKKDITGVFSIERFLSNEDRRVFVPPGVEKQILSVNLDTLIKDFRPQLILSPLTQEVPFEFEPNSNKRFGEVTKAITITDTIVSAQTSNNGTGNIVINLPSRGVYGMLLENQSTTDLAFSLNNEIVTTRVFIDTYKSSNLSVSSLVPVTNRKSLILRKRSTQEFLIYNDNPVNVSFSLLFNSVASSLFVTPESTTTSDSSSTLSREEIEKLAGGGAGGCFIATASFGSLDHPLVRILCEFRESILLGSETGEFFVRSYYHYSPPLANLIEGSTILRILTSLCLLPVVVLAFLILNPWLLFAGFLALPLRSKNHG